MTVRTCRAIVRSAMIVAILYCGGCEGLMIEPMATDDVELLQGTWVGREIGGEGGRWSFAVSGEAVEVKGPAPQAYSGSMIINSDVRPRQLDLEIEKCIVPQYVGRRMLAIYRIDANRLTLVSVEPGSTMRPIFFKPGYGGRIFVFTREQTQSADTDAEVRVPSYLAGYEERYEKDPHGAAVAWFKEAKFGLFVHYALASVLERGKPEYIGLIEKDSSGAVEHKLFEQFKAEQFDAEKICDLAIAARMRYVTFTTAHLGRMYMFKTKLTDFTSLNSPARRDLVAEMAAACRRKGLGLFLYVPPEVARTDDEHIERNHTMLRELLTQYGPIAGIWFDGIGDYYKNPENYERLGETYALVRSLQEQCLVSFKEGAIGREDFVTPEHFLLPTPMKWDTEKRQERWEIRRQRWEKNNRQRWEKYFRHTPAEINTVMQECMNRDGVGEPGGWINDESARHLTADEVMSLLGKARSLGANMLLNIGPRGDGSIHPDDERVLREVGRRLKEGGFPE